MRTLLLVCLFGFMAACSPQPKTSTPDVFTVIDTDKDGKLSLDEVIKGSKNPDKAQVQDHFVNRNWKGDGYIDRQQFDAWREVEFDGDF